MISIFPNSKLLPTRLLIINENGLLTQYLILNLEFERDTIVEFHFDPNKIGYDTGTIANPHRVDISSKVISQWFFYNVDSRG